MIHCLTLSWNGVDKLKKLKPGLIKNLTNCNQEFLWHIKDNGSKDGTIEIIKNWDNVIAYPIDHNRDNFAQGMNYLFNKIKPNDDDYILLTNNDLIIGNDTSILEMLSVFNRSNVGAVGARLLYPNSNKLQHAGVCFIKKYNYLPYHYKHKEISTLNDELIKPVQAVTGAFMLLKANEYKQIYSNNKSGNVGMDENYFWCYEDIDACLTIKYNLQKEIIYCGKTTIYHEESASLTLNPINKLLMPYNLNYFKKKWNGKYKFED